MSETISDEAFNDVDRINLEQLTLGKYVMHSQTTDLSNQDRASSNYDAANVEITNIRKLPEGYVFNIDVLSKDNEPKDPVILQVKKTEDKDISHYTVIPSMDSSEEYPLLTDLFFSQIPID